MKYDSSIYDESTDTSKLSDCAGNFRPRRRQGVLL